MIDAVNSLSPALGCPFDRRDMIVGKVTEGPARFNPARRAPDVLGIALRPVRGAATASRAAISPQRLLERGRVETPAGHTVRMVAFGSVAETDQTSREWHAVSMRHVVGFRRCSGTPQVKKSDGRRPRTAEKWGADTPNA